VLKKKKREPTVKEILKEANTIIPPPEVLVDNVEAVLSYIYAKDAETDQKILESSTQDNGDRVSPKRYFKRDLLAVRSVIENQMKHVTKGCLSDPPSDFQGQHL
jgi:hypothetical protein